MFGNVPWSRTGCAPVGSNEKRRQRTASVARTDNLSSMAGSREPRRTEWVAAIPFSSGTSFAGRLSKLGGTLVLTNDSVVFKPLAHIGRTRIRSLQNLEAVSQFAEKPPRLRLTSTDAKPLTLTVLPRRLTPVWSNDASARDDAVAAIAAAISKGRV